eukprot:Gb_15113 [translate_table: standard]
MMVADWTEVYKVRVSYRGFLGGWTGQRSCTRCQCPGFGRSRGKRLEIDTRDVQWSTCQGEPSQAARTLTRVESSSKSKSCALGARLREIRVM